jgi:hypothetical protein
VIEPSLAGAVVLVLKSGGDLHLEICALSVECCELFVQFFDLSARGGLELFKIFLKLFVQLLGSVQLDVKHESFSLDFKLLFLELSHNFVEVLQHRGILLLEQEDVLVLRLVVIVQATDARFLLVLLDLFSEDLELKVHEVELLLEIFDVLINLRAWIVRVQELFLVVQILTSEVHLDGGLVTGGVTKLGN